MDFEAEDGNWMMRALLGNNDDDVRPDYVDLSVGKHIALIFVGLGVGGVGGFAGVGGAPIMVSCLVFLEYCQREAQGTVLAVMLPPMSLMGVLAMKDRAMIMWTYSVPAFVTYACFSYVGALLAYEFPQDTLAAMFGIFLTLLGVRYAVQFIKAKRFEWEEYAAMPKPIKAEVLPEVLVELPGHKPATDRHEKPTAEENEAAAKRVDEEAAIEVARPENAEERRSRHAIADKTMNADGPTVKEGFPLPFSMLTITCVGAVVGTVGGLFGVGAGVLMVPVFTDLCGLHKDDARVLSLMILLPPVSAGAVIKYTQEDAVDFVMASVLFCLYFFANYYGAKMGKKASTQNFKAGFGSCLTILGLVIFFFAVLGNPSGDLERCEDD